MTNPNIPPEIADATPAPAPVRISPEVRETILTALDEARNSTDTELRVRDVKDAIAFVEALLAEGWRNAKAAISGETPGAKP